MLTGCLDRLGLDSAHLVGHSYGGLFGMWLALDAPERVRSVVCVGTPAVALGARPDFTLRVLSRPLIGPLSLAAPNPSFVYRQILAASVGPTAVRAVPKQLHRATYLGTRRRGFANTVYTYLREQFAGVRATPPRYVLQDDELKRTAVPLLIIWGEHDARYQPVDVAERRAALIPTVRFERVRGGHEPWLDDLDHCAGLLAGWVDRNPHPLQAATKTGGSDAGAN
jgi:pimeloyl-ACP methyl ester carboxylesterase